MNASSGFPLQDASVPPNTQEEKADVCGCSCDSKVKSLGSNELSVSLIGLSSAKSHESMACCPELVDLGMPLPSTKELVELKSG